MTLNIPAYLRRIGYADPVRPDIETLRGLHRAHMLAVPFENLDIGLGRQIVCEEESFLSKIVQRRRGGFCYEMNGAFAALLRGLGFAVTLLSARVPRDDGSASPEFDHMALRVDLLDLNEPWLADVGFGDCFLEPLRLTAGVEQLSAGRKYRLTEQAGRWRVERMESDSWRPQYIFGLEPHLLLEFAPMCHYHQTSPESSFTRKRICTIATGEGRITLSDLKLIITRHGKREERMLESEDQWHAALRDNFGVVLEEKSAELRR